MPVFEVLGRFETCINCSKRALRLLEQLAASPEIPYVDRTLRRLLRTFEKSVTGVRDIEHVDEDITHAGIRDGEAHLLALNTPEGDRLLSAITSRSKVR
jgi:hypothetical protein